MTEKHDNDKQPDEGSLRDALMPKKEERARPRDTYGENSSLQDALLPKDHKPSPPPASPEKPKTAVPPSAPAQISKPTTPSKSADASNRIIQAIVTLAIVVGVAVVYFAARASKSPPPTIETVSTATPTNTPATPAKPAPESTPVAELAPSLDWGDPGPMSIATIQEQGRIIDVHEHIESLEEAPMFLATMDRLGIQKVCLMGSSKFTLTMNERYGFTRYDENNEELIKIVEAYPGRFEAWPTINPDDPEKLTKVQGLVERGATGVKLYIGHGFVKRDRAYMFHTMAMDDPTMLPFFAWCEENRIPLAFHVNPYKAKVGFAQEFIAVLTQFPDLKVIAPHFILSSVKSTRLEELLDTFPNLYTDISFGDYFMKERLIHISKNPKKFRRIFKKYPNRFMFAADLVMIKGRHEDWAPTQMKAYLDMLTKETYTTAAIPGKTLNGLALSNDLVSRVLFRNYLAFRVRQPNGTKITREIDWKRMGVEPVKRRPGQAFPPKPKNK